MPAPATSRLQTSLSIVVAAASTPAPTYATPSVSSSPWIVPSSPYGPCSTGKTTSTSPIEALAESARRPAPGASATPSAPAGCRSAGASLPGCSASGPSTTDQRPARSISIGTTSHPAASRPAITERADASDTSCSLERPPASTAMRSGVTAWSWSGRSSCRSPCTSRPSRSPCDRGQAGHPAEG